MGENGGFNISDLAGLSEPLTKLIETISCAIGKVYEPWHIKRVAKAKAAELKLISGAINDNLQLPTRYENGDLVIDSTDANELVQRAQNRFLFQEMKKQQNIESVIGIAYSRLEQVDSVSKVPVDSDWISEFFDNVANISSEKMQILWGKVLAGEVENPGKFSKRTLDVLKNLTQNEATTFQELIPYVLRCPGDDDNSFEDYFLLEGVENRFLPKYNIPFIKIMQLSEADLISENSLINIFFGIKAHECQYIKGINKSIKLENISPDDTTIYVRHPAYFLTEAGKEIISILLEESSEGSPNEYLSDCLEEIKTNGIELSDQSPAPARMSLEIV